MNYNEPVVIEILTSRNRTITIPVHALVLDFRTFENSDIIDKVKVLHIYNLKAFYELQNYSDVKESHDGICELKESSYQSLHKNLKTVVDIKRDPNLKNFLDRP